MPDKTYQAGIRWRLPQRVRELQAGWSWNALAEGQVHDKS